MGDTRSSDLQPRLRQLVDPLDPVPGDELPSIVRTMSDRDPQQASVVEPTLKELIARAEPMGDLTRFIIDDLTEADEEAFFAILANA